jgi:hypothetical protein
MIRHGLISILILALGWAEVLIAAPTEAAELNTRRVYDTHPKRLLSYPYGGTYLDISHAKRSFGYPYVGFYYGSYYAPPYGHYYGYSSYFDRPEPCFHRIRGCR